MFKQKGETILEILVAITVVVIIITSTYSLLLQAMKTNSTIKNRVIALNIAREGLEGVRSIRDTNWLRHSGNRRDKWLCRDAYVDPGNLDEEYTFASSISNDELYDTQFMRTCSHTNGTLTTPIDTVIESGGYILHYVNMGTATTGYAPGETLNQYVLEPKYTSAIINQNDDFIYNPNGAPVINMEEFRLYIEEHRNGIANQYTHNPIADERTLPMTENAPSIFYRKIVIDKVSPLEDPDAPGTENDPSGICSGDCETSKIKVTSIVEWQADSGEWENVMLETHLYDFYQRTTY